MTQDKRIEEMEYMLLNASNVLEHAYLFLKDNESTGYTKGACKSMSDKIKHFLKDDTEKEQERQRVLATFRKANEMASKIQSGEIKPRTVIKDHGCGHFSVNIEH